MLFTIVLLVYAQIGVGTLQQIPGKVKRLNDYIAHYEELTYDTDILHAHHSRAKRSLDNPYVELKFKAHGRDFHLRLRRDTSTFSKDFKRELSNGELVDHDTSYIYDGELWNEPNSQVYGSIIKGVFAGVIRTPKSTYHVEKAEHYFRGRNKRSFHSVIYADHHIQMDAVRKRREANDGAGVCGNANSEVYKWMKEVQNSAVHEEQPVKRDTSERRPFENIYTREYNIYKNMRSEEQERKERKKRAPEDDKRTCALFLQSDTLLWDYFTSEDGLNFNSVQAVEEITSFFSLHVKGVKTIYSETDFKHDTHGLRYLGFSFTVRRVKINSTEDCKDPYNRFCQKNIDVSNFLNLNSLQNHNDYCLAYVFTYRDFTGGTLGLAWVGSNTRASGGICEVWKQYTETGNRIHKSLNTGIVTILNYGARVPPKVSTLTFAHEIGHNFGSPHDDGPGCVATNDEEGNYIMFASATSGDLPNNNRFSTCSLTNITLVLEAVINEREGKKNCFVESEEAFCGNKIVEENEQCDCGYDEDCDDACCYAYRNKEAPEKKCQLKSTAQCSPTAGPCCSRECKKIPSSENLLCRREEDCTEESFCNGVSASCPASTPKANLTDCNEFTQVCINGECQLSICNKLGWSQCYIESETEDGKDKEPIDKKTLCFVACENPTTAACVSTGDAADLAKPENKKLADFLETHNKPKGIILAPGAPCDNFRGYCDVFQKCRGVDADGPLARLKNLLLSKDTLIRIKDWMIKYWWAVLLIIIGGIILMGLFITACAVHTPSSNPKRPPARKISLMSHHSKHQRPPAYSANPNRGGGQPNPKGRVTASSHPPAYNPAFQMNNPQTNNPQRI